MSKSVIVWASDIPGLEIEETFVPPEDVGPPEEDPKIINWWKSLAETAIYFIGNGAEWKNGPVIKLEKINNRTRTLASGVIANPSPWVEEGNLSISILPTKNKMGYECKLWYENSMFSPASLEREWFCYAPKNKMEGKERTAKLTHSVYNGILHAFMDYHPEILANLEKSSAEGN